MEDMDIQEIKVSKSWEPHVELMLHRFDKELRIKWLPEFLSKLVRRFRTKNKIKEIKTSFGELKVVGNFTGVFKDIVTETKKNCRDTCEFCGNPDTEKVTIKSWVYNSCESCKEKKK